VFSKGAQLHCRRGDQTSTVRILAAREHKGRLLLRIEGVEDADAAIAYTGATFFAPREVLDVASDEYLDVDLIGCRLAGPNGEDYGAVDDVEHYPASDMLVVGGKMVPMVRAIVLEIDVAAKRIVIDPPAGLLE